MSWCVLPLLPLKRRAANKHSSSSATCTSVDCVVGSGTCPRGYAAVQSLVSLCLHTVQPVGVSSAKVERARARLRADPGDAEAAAVLAAEAAGLPLEQARGVYAELVAVHPTAAGVWTAWMDAELKSQPRDDDTLRGAFAQCLLVCPFVELWTLYVRFVRATHDVATPEGCAAVRGAHEFALDRLGEDYGSGPLWQEYIAFLKAAQPTILHPGAVNADSARMGDVRKAYQRALVSPHNALEPLWKEYDTWENGLNRQLARPLLQDMQPKTAAARSAAQERRRFVDAVRQVAQAIPPKGPGVAEAATAIGEAASGVWRALVAHECDTARVLTSPARGALAWDQALCVFATWPDWWLAAARWHALGGRHSQAAALLTRAQGLMPGCLALGLALADAIEASGDIPGARAWYEEALERLVPGHAASEAKAEAGGAQGAGEQGDGDGGDSLMKDDTALLWISYMRFARRAEGPLAARRVFARARRCGGGAGWRVYCAAASQEHAASGDLKVARNILELGLKRYLTHTDYVLYYADFLNRSADATNARVLFERVLSACSAAVAGTDITQQGDAGAQQERNVPAPSDIARLWDAYVAFEYSHGTLHAAIDADARREAALSALAKSHLVVGGNAPAAGGAAVGPPAPKVIALEVVQRFSWGDLLPCEPALVEHFASADVAATTQAALAAWAAASAAAPLSSAHGLRGTGAVSGGAAQAAASRGHGAVPSTAGHQAPPPPPPPMGLPPGMAPLPSAVPLAQQPPAQAQLPQDPLSVLGLNELAAFITSLPPFASIAYLPIPSVDAVISVMLRHDPTQWLAAQQLASMTPQQQAAFIQQQMAAQAAAAAGMAPHGGGHQPGAKRKAGDDAFGQQQVGDSNDMFRARMRARNA